MQIDVNWTNFISLKQGFTIYFMWLFPDAFSELRKAFKINRFAKIVNSIFANHSALDVWQGYEYAPDPISHMLGYTDQIKLSVLEFF